MIDSAQSTRAARYRGLAMRTYDLADQADDAAVIGAYLVIAAKWLRMAEHAEHARHAERPAASALRRCA